MDALTHAGRVYGVDRALVKAVVHLESRFNPRAVSRAGAQGLMQLIPRTARRLAVSDSFKPWQNIDGGTRYLRAMQDRSPGDSLPLAAYSAGPHVVTCYEGIPPFRETQTYVRRVMRLFERCGADFR